MQKKMNAPFEVHMQLLSAYLDMVEKAHYRPAAPSDGMGNIVEDEPESLADARARLYLEGYEYANDWWDDEEEMEFYVGCCNFSTRPASVFALEAVRCMAGGNEGNATAERLLQMALKSLQDARGE